MRIRQLVIIFVLLVFPVGLFCQDEARSDSKAASPTCPGIEVVGPQSVVEPGETMAFRVDVEGPADGLSFRWTVNIGEIVSGQGGQKIEVGDTLEMEGETIEATVFVEGLPDGCSGKSSDTAEIARLLKDCGLRDEFTSISRDDLRARIDNLMIRLQSNPNTIGYVVSFGNAEEVERRHQIVRDHIEFRKYDPSRIFMIYCKYEEKLRTFTTVQIEGFEIPCGN